MSDTTEPRHCEDYIEDFMQPAPLRWFLFIERLSADLKHLAHSQGTRPKLFADHDGKRVRVVMASSMGDVGITSNLDAEHGYSKRVAVEDLTNFGSEP